MEDDDIKWKQWVKQHWLKNGDKNTKFYHMHVNQQRKINKISKIMDLNCCFVTNQHSIGDVFSQFFSQLFSTSNHCVSTKMNRILLVEFTAQEIEEAMFMMNPIRADQGSRSRWIFSMFLSETLVYYRE